MSGFRRLQEVLRRNRATVQATFNDATLHRVAIPARGRWPLIHIRVRALPDSLRANQFACIRHKFRLWLHRPSDQKGAMVSFQRSTS